MTASLAVYVNSDDALLVWYPDPLEPTCLGFAVERKLSRGGGRAKTKWLDNFTRLGPEEHQTGKPQPSDKWPFRALSWTDHTVEPGDTLSYRVMPVLEGEAHPSKERASEWSEPRTVGATSETPFSGFFNRGFVMSQFVSRYLDEHYKGMDRNQALRQFKKDLHADLEDKLRVFLSGQVRTTMTRLLDDVARDGGHAYAALFELDDDELLNGLLALGPKAHVVLSNGSVKAKKKPDGKKETSDEARKHDENEEARKRLIEKGVDVEDDNRFISPGALGHNKFLVITDAADNPLRAWTGSTNWTTTGLCTQLNNGLLIEDKDIAGIYLEQWKALRKAKSKHPPDLAISNAEPRTVGEDKAGHVRASVHFTHAKSGVDLDVLREIVMGTQQGILFLMFMPGDGGVLHDLEELAAAKPDVLIRGVVSELPKGRQDEKTGGTTELKVTLFGDPKAKKLAPRTFDVVQPQGQDHPAAYWAVETTRNQFRGNVGAAIIHSKVLVADPFTDDPIVVTGSHNFSVSASDGNDENFIVVRGDRALAEAYAVNVDSAWRHYSRRIGNPYEGLTGVDYLRAMAEDRKRELSFWGL